jgi:predicted RNase H-like HicB family nuclease
MIAVPTLTEKDASGFQKLSTFSESRANVGKAIKATIATLMPVPEELLYAGAIHPELRIVVAFEVRFERIEGGYAAVVRDLEEYGVGDTRSDALEDLRITLRELYLSLEQDQSRLSSDLLSIWGRLRSHVTRIQR